MRHVVKSLENPGLVAEGLNALEEVLVRRGRCPPMGQGISNAVGIDGQTPVMKYQPLYSRVTAASGGVALLFAQLSIKASPGPASLLAEPPAGSGFRPHPIGPRSVSALIRLRCRP